MTAPDVLTVEEAAALLRWSKRTAYRRIKDGTFPVPVVKCGSLTRIPRIPLERLLAGELTEAS